MNCDSGLHETYYIVIHPIRLILPVVILAFLCRGMMSYFLPRRFALRFGIDRDNAAAFAAIRAAGARDGMIGLSAIVLTIMAYDAAVGVLALAGAVIALADAAVILRLEGSVNRIGLWVPALVLSMMGFVQLYSLPQQFLTSPPLLP